MKLLAVTNFQGTYRFLSNFSPSPISLAGLEFPTIEHAYQSAKTLDSAWRQFTDPQLTPGQAKRLGRSLVLRPDWEDVKLTVMEDLLRMKFKHPDLKQKLLNTGDALLIEGNNWGDTFWGAVDIEKDGSWTGENHLGRLLMKIRGELK